MIRNPEENKKRLLITLEKHLGIVTEACKEADISRTIFYKYCKEDPDFKAAVDDINEITIDFAENALLKKIKEGSERSILFYMRYRARKRGYSDSIDITSDGEKIVSEIKVNIVLPKRDEEYE
jgi:hypothetical protein